MPPEGCGEKGLLAAFGLVGELIGELPPEYTPLTGLTRVGSPIAKRTLCPLLTLFVDVSAVGEATGLSASSTVTPFDSI